MGAFKSCSSRETGRRLWQRGYFGRIVRNEQELAELREYVATNPLRWALRRETTPVV